MVDVIADRLNAYINVPILLNYWMTLEKYQNKTNEKGDIYRDLFQEPSETFKTSERAAGLLVPLYCASS